MYYTHDNIDDVPHYRKVTEKAPLHFKFYSDPGHGWLAVKKSVLEKHGILDKISTYSYIKGDTYYLEEDCDFSLLIETLVDANVNYSIEEEIMGNNSVIRNYQHVS